jgi:hypothetical protein
MKHVGTAALLVTLETGDGHDWARAYTWYEVQPLHGA